MRVDVPGRAHNGVGAFKAPRFDGIDFGALCRNGAVPANRSRIPYAEQYTYADLRVERRRSQENHYQSRQNSAQSVHRKFLITLEAQMQAQLELPLGRRYRFDYTGIRHAGLVCRQAELGRVEHVEDFSGELYGEL